MEMQKTSKLLLIVFVIVLVLAATFYYFGFVKKENVAAEVFPKETHVSEDVVLQQGTALDIATKLIDATRASYSKTGAFRFSSDDWQKGYTFICTSGPCIIVAQADTRENLYHVYEYYNGSLTKLEYSFDYADWDGLGEIMPFIQSDLSPTIRISKVPGDIDFITFDLRNDTSAKILGSLRSGNNDAFSQRTIEYKYGGTTYELEYSVDGTCEDPAIDSYTLYGVKAVIGKDVYNFNFPASLKVACMDYEQMSHLPSIVTDFTDINAIGSRLYFSVSLFDVSKNTSTKYKLSLENGKGFSLVTE